MPDEREALEQVERLVRDAHEKAEAAARAAAAGLPPRGWEAAAGERPAGAGTPDLSAVLALLDTARQAIPPELARQLADALRQLLLAVRALIDFYVERLGRVGEPPAEVEDIPID